MAAGFKNIEDNCLKIVFLNLPLKDKFLYRRVCKKWRDMLNKIIKNQSSLALFDKQYPLESSDSYCKHRISETDIVLSKHFEWKLDGLAKMLKLLPGMQHLNIRVLDKEQLEKITDELVEDLEKLDCLELSFSYVLLKFVDKFGDTLKYIDCCYFNTNETLADTLVCCEKLVYLYMIGCPEFTSDLLKTSTSPNLTYVYSMERIMFSGFEDKFPNKKYPKKLKGLGFVPAKDLTIICKEFPDLEEILVEFHQGYVALTELSKLKKLQNLYIPEYNKKKPLDENLIYIFKNCPLIKSLNLQNVNLTDTALLEIPNLCKNLEKLYINNMQMAHFNPDDISDKSIKAIINAKTKLKTITIRGANSITLKNEEIKTKTGGNIDLYTTKK